MYPSGKVNSRREGSLVRTPSLHQKFKKYMLSSLAMLRGLTDYICVLSFATMKILAQRTINAGGNETENRGEGGQSGRENGGGGSTLTLFALSPPPKAVVATGVWRLHFRHERVRLGRRDKLNGTSRRMDRMPPAQSLQVKVKCRPTARL